MLLNKIIIVVPEKGLPAGEITGKLGEIGKTSAKMAILFCRFWIPVQESLQIEAGKQSDPINMTSLGCGEHALGERGEAKQDFFGDDYNTLLPYFHQAPDPPFRKIVALDAEVLEMPSNLDGSKMNRRVFLF